MKTTQQIAKQTSHAFGKTIYLLGVDTYGKKYWLEEASFDCGWSWGFGYIETYTNNDCPSRARDIDSHSHFNSMFFNCEGNGFDNFKIFFVKSTLNDSELWKLCELIQTFYIMRDYSDMLHRGGMNYTQNVCKDIIKNDAEYERVNKIVLPEIFKEIYKLLEGARV